MRTRTLSLPLLFPLLLLCLFAAQAASGLGTVTLRATRTALLADGRQSVEIIAEVRDTNGRPANESVQFQTTLGTLSQARVQAFSGVATARLTSATISGIAHVTAFTSGGSVATLDILFTDDPQDLFEGNMYMECTASSYLAYSATDRIIEAQGKEGGARLVFRNIEVTADRLQLQCDDNVIRAHNNVTIRRGKNVVKATRLFYSLQTNQGYALAEREGRLQPVSIHGENLRVDPSPAPIPASYISFRNLQVKLIIVARSITYFPQDKLQFRRPRFFQDNAQIMSLPYYELPLHSGELFSDQFVSVGTNGFGLELPFYYNLTPRSTGIVYLRHQRQLGRSYYGNAPGWALDVIQNYSSFGGRRYEGAYGFTNLTRNDWGFRWSHSQEFGAASQGGFYLDFPQHSGVLSTMNFSQQGRAIRWGTNLTAGQGFIRGRETALRSDIFAETQPRRLASSKDFMYTVGTNFLAGSLSSRDPLIGKSSQVAQGLTFRAFTRPITLGKRTTLTNSFTLGQNWGNSGATGGSALATLMLDHTLPGGGGINLTYDYVTQPAGLSFSSGKHRMSLNYNAYTSKRFQVFLFGSTFLDSRDASLLADMSYRLDKNWRLLTAATFQRFDDESFRDLQFTIGRRLGARELQLTYSTLNRRISFDFTATRF